ncbi:GAF domain-containing protein [Piscinibacter sp.]|jgi:hypothetical protein|uniref:GAF domain-containing protein n=1 Tax=Piscinibacter sp. TaxID=1903157 RepID=UPI00355ABD08
MPDLSAIHKICGLLDRGEIDRAQFFEQFTRESAAEIGCSRASVRMLVDTSGGRILRSLATYDATLERLVHAPDMANTNPAPYFALLLHDGCVVASDARTDPATVGFLDAYLLPMNVYSLLDVGFSVNGVLFGTFSCEMVAQAVQWAPRQLRLLRRIASRASLTLMHAVTAQVDTAPGALWEPSSPNRLITMTVPFDEDDTG